MRYGGVPVVEHDAVGLGAMVPISTALLDDLPNQGEIWRWVGERMQRQLWLDQVGEHDADPMQVVEYGVPIRWDDSTWIGTCDECGGSGEVPTVRFGGTA